MSMKKHKMRQQRQRYPEGKISDDDEGKLSMRVASDPVRQVVVIDYFGKPVTWFALSKKGALEFAAMIARKANELPDAPAVNTPPAEGVQ